MTAPNLDAEALFLLFTRIQLSGYAYDVQCNTAQYGIARLLWFFRVAKSRVECLRRSDGPVGRVVGGSRSSRFLDEVLDT